jgi:3-oxoacyl-[acyl-carrier protein] reductase
MLFNSYGHERWQSFLTNMFARTSVRFGKWMEARRGIWAQRQKTVIFGASSGIRAAVAGVLQPGGRVHFNSNRAGLKHCRRNQKRAEGKFIGGDVSDGKIAARLVDEAAASLGGLDIVINNAGSMFGRTAIATATDEQYRDVLDLNIGGVFFACRRAAVILQEQRSGTIINTTSVAARTGGGDGALWSAKALSVH